MPIDSNEKQMRGKVLMLGACCSIGQLIGAFIPPNACMTGYFAPCDSDRAVATNLAYCWVSGRFAIHLPVAQASNAL